MIGERTLSGFSPSRAMNNHESTSQYLSNSLPRPAGMPMLPGFTFNNPQRSDFHKQHVFDSKMGVGTLREPGTRGRERDVFPKGQTPGMSINERGHSNDFQPHFVEFDSKSLRFLSYFKEAVPESPAEQYRIRMCSIFYHLEDNTISITEPSQENSGIPQGQFLKRCHIAKAGTGTLQAPGSNPGDVYFNFTDFNIGCDITFFGRVYRIYDCDDFTADWMTRQGIQLNPAERCPEDRYLESRKQGTQFVIDRVREKEDTLRQFLDHDRKVLKFMGVWDDRDAVFGDKHYYIVYYFLADDSIQIVRQKDTTLSAETDPFLSLLKRRRLPKHIVTPDFSDRKTPHYLEMDLQVGHPLNVLGRQILLYDCDEYTRNHYKTKFNHAQSPFINVADPSHKMPIAIVPPHTGFGSEEDSMTSVTHLHPKPPRRDFRKFLLKDGEILRFGAYLDTPSVEDQDRRFVFGVYMSDNPITFAIFEIRGRNSGRPGGKFLLRNKVHKRNSAEYYAAGDFFVGAKVEVHSHRFILTQADEYSLSYMENEDLEFPKANLDYICEKVRDLVAQQDVDPRRVFDSINRDGSGLLNQADFKAALDRLNLTAYLAEQEVITLMRVFNLNNDGRINYNEFLSVVMPAQGDEDRRANVNMNQAREDMDTMNQNDQARFEMALSRVLRMLREKVFNRRKMLESKLRTANPTGDGYITIDNLRAALESLAVYLTDGETQILQNHFSSRTTNLIRFQTFLSSVCS